MSSSVKTSTPKTVVLFQGGLGDLGESFIKYCDEVISDLFVFFG